MPSSSLSHLISKYQNNYQELSPLQQHPQQQEESEHDEWQQKQPSSSSSLRRSIEERYTYDPIDDYYQGDQIEEKSQDQTQIHGDQRKVVSDDDEDGTGAGVGVGEMSYIRTGGTTNDNESSRAKANYDFKKNVENREFYNLTGNQHDSKSMNSGAARKRTRNRGSIQDEGETNEEYRERMARQQIVQSRRKRFRSRKYNFENEIDYCESIARMIHLKMDADGRLPLERRKLGDKDGDRRTEYIDTSDLDDIDTDSDMGTQDDNHNQTGKSGNQHVLGSLLDHIQKQEDELIRLQQQMMKTDDDDVLYDEDQMERYPLSFLRQGYVAPLPTDPNVKQYSYRRRPLPSSILHAVRANDMFTQEQKGIRKKFGKIDKSSRISSPLPQSNQIEGPISRETKISPMKIGPLVNQKRKVSRHDGYIARRFLPLNCFNPNLNRLQYPKFRDTYHYLPITRQDPPTSLRLNTAKSDAGAFLKSNSKKNRLYERRNKSFNPLHFHSRNIHLLAARFIVSCGGIITEDDNNTDNGLNIKNNLSRILKMLHCKKSTSSRTSTLILQSQEMASNYAMWQHLEPRIKSLYKMEYLDDKEYNFLQKELLSDKSEMFVDPYAISDGYDLKLSATRKRKRILDAIEKLENTVNEGAEEREGCKQSNGSIDEGLEKGTERTDLIGETKQDTIDIDIDIDIDTDSATNTGKKELPPFRPFFSLQKGKKYSGSPSTFRGEKYSEVIHTSELDLDTIRLTLAALYSELSQHRSKLFNNEPSDNTGNISTRRMKDEIQAIHRTIMSYFEIVTNKIWYIGNDATTGAGRFYKNLLNGPLASTILMRQSYVANGGSFYLTSTQYDHDDKLQPFDSGCDLEENQTTRGGKSVKTDFRSIAEELYSFGSKLRGDNKLLIFTEIHLTTGIAMIAKNLPSYAAEIISRSLIQDDGQSQQTPFHLMRLALTQMEQKEDVVRKQGMALYQGNLEERIDIDLLIETLNNAAEIFYDCVERDSTNLDCMSWYVAVRIGSMIVSSGIKIGSGPCLAARPDYLVEDDRNSNLRCRHSDYSNLRAICSHAIREFISWQNRDPHPGQRYHYAIKAILEWDEVVFLLSFRPLIHQNCYRKICYLHASHTMDWALNEPSIEALKYLLRSFYDGLITRKQMLSFLAALVETDGTNARYWAMLACALGPLGSDDIECNDKNCTQCNRLIEGTFNHKKLNRLKKKQDWWGKVPTDWWETHYLSTPQIDRFGKKDIENMEKTKQDIQSNNRGKQPISSLSNSNSKPGKRDLTDVSWMWPSEPSEEDEEDEEEQTSNSESGSESDSHSDAENKNKKRANKYSRLLPGGKVEDINRIMVDPLFDTMDNECTTLASKVLVVCHLYGTQHKFVEGTIRYLLKVDQNHKGNSEKIKALSFIALQNLNVFSYMEDCTNEYNSSRKRNAGLRTQFPFNFTSL